MLPDGWGGKGSTSCAQDTLVRAPKSATPLVSSDKLIRASVVFMARPQCHTTENGDDCRISVATLSAHGNFGQPPPNGRNGSNAAEPVKPDGAVGPLLIRWRP